MKRIFIVSLLLINIKIYSQIYNATYFTRFCKYTFNERYQYLTNPITGWEYTGKEDKSKNGWVIFQYSFARKSDGTLYIIHLSSGFDKITNEKISDVMIEIYNETVFKKWITTFKDAGNVFTLGDDGMWCTKDDMICSFVKKVSGVYAYCFSMVPNPN
ncbi:MAG: hypothetical protein ACYDCN_12615 [Bacteroidia bacterium]